MIAASDCVAVVLAAGKGSRFGGGKLDVEIDGIAAGTRAWRAIGHRRWHRAFVVVPTEAPQFAKHLVGVGVELLINRNINYGLSHSIALAARTAQDIRAQALLVILADMPLVRSVTIDGILAAHNAGCGASATVSRYEDGGLGPPALFGHGWFADLQALSGDRGAGKLLAERPDRVKVIDLPHDEAFDLDRPGDVDRIAALRSGETDMSA